MTKLINGELIERLFFSMLVIGILMAVFGGLRFFDLSGQIANNEAAQIHASGEEVLVESNVQAQGLVAADLERRRLVNERFNMMVVGGIGLALIGVGWMATDVVRTRRRKPQGESTTASSVIDATS